ncbi:MAG: methyltransferase domain-containing protein [Planctomycetaceae bacterium]|nr:methyltransferase domain-containing protein [Planctomycetaceae bacterium]
MSADTTQVTEFWNNVFASDSSIERPAIDDPDLQNALRHFGDVQGKRLLDIGCGKGATSLFFAQHGAEVVSVDFSEVAIENLKKFCRANNIPNIQPVLLRAQEIETIGPFDGVFGSLILHHIEPFNDFAAILRRTIAPGGKGFFIENNASSKLMLWVRKHIVGRLWITRLSDGEEFPFEPAEVEMLRAHFDVDVEYPELLYFRLISAYLFRCRMMKPFEILDNFFYRYPGFRRCSYRQYVKLS